MDANSISLRLCVGLSLPALYTVYRAVYTSRNDRNKTITPTDERVLILGASSGIGREIAHVYAKRGARVFLVGRRAEHLAAVVRECQHLAVESKIAGVPTDITNVDDMLVVRATLEKEWGGLDTIIVAAGVSALQPLMAVAGVQSTPTEQATSEGIKRAVEITAAATAVNYVGPLVAAITFIPLLTQTSPSPSILLISSLAAVIPAPTRSLYASTKAASLVLYQALSIEHPAVSFSFVLPSTVQGDFRASAVDSGPVREVDPNTHGLKVADVAVDCVKAVDEKQKTVFLPASMRWGHLLYWIWPSFVESKARKKYNFATE